MTRKWPILLLVLAVAAVAVFVSNEMTQAQERPERPGGGGAMRGGPGGFGGGGFSATGIIDSSWSDLTFAVKVDDETLIKARPVYQKSRDDLAKAVEEARAAGDFQSMRDTMTQVRGEFKAALGKVLTQDQIAKLDELEQERMQQQMNRRGGGGGRPDGGNR